MNSLPLISVVVPVYNSEKYLSYCIESIINQTYKNLDIILVDDGSTDESFKICQNYKNKDNRIQIIRQKNSGTTKARLTGVLNAKGGYISFVDSDDYIDKNMYQLIVQENIENFDAISFGLKEIYEDFVNNKSDNFKPGDYSKLDLEEKIYPSMLSGEYFFDFGILPNIYTLVARKKIVKDILEKIDPIIKIGEDADTVYQILLSCQNLKIINIFPYNYRKRYDSTMSIKLPFSSIKALYNDLYNCFSKEKLKKQLINQLNEYITWLILLKRPEIMFNKENDVLNLNNKEIVLYGAGGFGRELYRIYSEESLPFDIKYWVDKRYNIYRDINLPVLSPEILTKKNYDKIFISVLDYKILKDIKKYIIGMGIEEEKIVYFSKENIKDLDIKELLND